MRLLLNRALSVATFALVLCPMSVPIIIDDQYCIVEETLTSLTIDAYPSRRFYDPHGIALAAVTVQKLNCVKLEEH